MIKIALADWNQTYCEGLQTMLEQVDDFTVTIIPPETFFEEIAKDPSVAVLLVDDDLYQQCREKAERNDKPRSSFKTIIMTMDREELICPPHGLGVICKGTGKKEFEMRIRKLTGTTGGSEARVG
jgi:hypothetical protein